MLGENDMKWLAEAPSNVALIKYMGKAKADDNIPANPSLSYTLNHLQSVVELESYQGPQDIWEPLEIPGGSTPVLQLSESAQNRFIAHLNTLKRYFDYQGFFIIRSTNNFPMSSGLASSASSFAALTLCAARAITTLTSTPQPSLDRLAQLSRQGSGSSCRSFYPSWALWENKMVEPIELPYADLIHLAIIVTHEPKKVSSSEAHQRVMSSPEYPKRAEQARQHLTRLIDRLEAKDWQASYSICWDEFEAMHQLFETSVPAFSYRNDEVHAVLRHLQQLWETKGDGPLVTMDAGPNIHCLFRPDQFDLAQQVRRELIVDHDVI